jgi:thioredoxin reductase
MKELTIIGAGKAGINLAKELRQLSKDLRIKLIDKNKYSFDKKDIFYLLIKRDTQKLVSLEDFSREWGLDFIKKEVEDLNFNKRLIYFKDGSRLEFSNLVISCGPTSKDLSIRGSRLDGFSYLCDIDLFFIRDYLRVASDIVIFATTLLGLKLAFYISFLGKEIKLLTSDLNFLGGQKDKILSKLKERGVNVYQNVQITEIVGEGKVVATKTSIPKVFSSQLVFVDSGLSPNYKLLDFPTQGSFFTPYSGVYLLGDVRNQRLEDEHFFFFNSLNIENEARYLSKYLLAGVDACEIQEQYNRTGQIEDFLREEFEEEKVLSLMRR